VENTVYSIQPSPFQGENFGKIYQMWNLGYILTTISRPVPGDVDNLYNAIWRDISDHQTNNSF
jgi:hypothetical protein